jgi:hypothetical protein
MRLDHGEASTRRRRRRRGGGGGGGGGRRRKKKKKKEKEKKENADRHSYTERYFTLIKFQSVTSPQAGVFVFHSSSLMDEDIKFRICYHITFVLH